jgi:hypothetical protein
MDSFKKTERLKRSINQKDMKVIDINNSIEKTTLEYKVLGNSGSFYNIKIPLNGEINCQCIDQRKTKSFCKHIFLIYVKIFKIIPDIDNLSLFINKETYDNLLIKHNEFINKSLIKKEETSENINIRNEDDDCSICFCEIDKCDIYACHECKNGFHLSCINQMMKYNNKCPLCREVIILKDKNSIVVDDKDIINLIKQIERM